MDFSLTEEQELLLASIRELITTNFPEEYFRTCDQNGTYPREFMRALADNGISMLGVPEEFGGIPADYVTQMLALMAIKIDNMRNMVLKVAWQADQHQSLRTSAALAKLYCARTAMEVIDDAIQIMGGLGYTDEARVSRFWRDVRCERIGGGTDEIMIYVAGRQILKDYQNK
ncbi:hypothetical protein E8730_002479 [Escherichia coli]|uniref:acyl-CoA dehydrogenase family protein n=1 Tax=Escherichia coli TaxID=562 RepID=UPI000BE57124|nr:acyl-CoA dehydrogenase family protein [Escherichia coli]EEZ2686564.1 hypothetical protein [Escherichia coli]EFE3692069.1 hypothetical protein [Escherichia coli]EFL5713454.1 hypothetical protein [Escherichia coli]MDD8365454.1 acyl-CoA dehydrogenase family protein [Escherichia coli]MDD8397282.1 acyl-CoA dehydrogenase family protein [Escherichia coli]